MQQVRPTGQKVTRPRKSTCGLSALDGIFIRVNRRMRYKSEDTNKLEMEAGNLAMKSETIIGTRKISRSFSSQHA